MIPVTEWRELPYIPRGAMYGLFAPCVCASCGGEMFARDPRGGVEPHSKHAHPESDGLVGFPRCLHLACFLEEWDARHLTPPA